MAHRWRDLSNQLRYDSADPGGQRWRIDVDQLYAIFGGNALQVSGQQRDPPDQAQSGKDGTGGRAVHLGEPALP